MRFTFPRSKLRALGRRLWPGGGMALLVAGLLNLGVWKPLEQVAYNTLFHLRGDLPWDDRVVLVVVDEASLKQLGQFPLARRYYTQLLTTLTPAEPAVVVLDVVFSESTPDDAALAEAMTRLGRVVLAQAWDSYGQPLPPVATLRRVAIATGHVLNRPDTDGVTRQVEPEVQGVPHLGLATLQVYDLTQQAVSLKELSAAPLWINWTGSARQVQSYSLVQVIQGQIPIQAFRDKIVVVGVTAGGLGNVFTPFNRNPPISGVYLDATLLTNILNQQLLTVLPSGGQVLLLCGLGLIWSLGLSYQRSGLRPVLLLGGCLGWGGVALVAFWQGYWVPVAAPMIVLGLTTMALEGYERLQLNRRLQRDIQRLWQSHHHDLLVTPELTPVSPPLDPQPLQPSTQLADLAERFARSQSAHAAIARNLSLGLLAADRSGQVWFCNPTAMEWLQVQVGDCLTQRLIPHWWNLADWQQDWQLLEAGQHVSRELQRHEHWFAAKLEPLFYQPALNSAPLPTAPTGVLLLLENITPRKQVEGKIRQALEREKELNELKSRFVSMVSHELRTPLTTIQSAAELLQYYEWSETEKHERFQQIHRSIQHMVHLIEGVLVIGKAETDTSFFNPTLVNLAEFCHDLLADMQVGIGVSHGIRLVIRGVIQPNWVDPALFRQILTNLVSNAVKYSPQGGDVVLELEYQSDQILLRVRDQGIGIPAEDLQHLFDHFHRAANVGSIAGTGLGLAIVKRSVEIHKGRVSVESQVGVGTQFTVMLPITPLIPQSV